MLNHILKLITNQWKSNIWILIELFISFICLFLVFSVVGRLLERDRMDKGFDIRHVYQVSWSLRDAEGDGERHVKEDLTELVRRLRQYPGVEALCLTDSRAHPYTGSMKGEAFYRDTLRTDFGCAGELTREAINVFRYHSIDPKLSLSEEAKEADFLLSRKTMEQLFDKGTAKGRVRNKKEGADNQIALAVTGNTPRCEYFAEDIFGWTLVNEENLLTDKANPGSLCIFLRVMPNADRHFTDRFWKDMRGRLQVGDCMITNLVPMETVRSAFINIIGIDLYYTFAYLLMGFFLLCAFLGVIGTFWFRTQSRTSEIGLRMALGATRRNTRRLVVCEALLLFALVWLPGMVIIYLVKDSIMTKYTSLIGESNYFLLITFVSTAVMSLLILAGTWYPARQASRINPVDALHYE